MSTILIVEDDENLRLTLCDILELEGYQVISAGDLKQAKQAIATQAFDLILLDIMLPDGNGYAFCQYLREQQCLSFVLMLTARSLEQDLIDGFISGADDYVSKPYKSAELLLRIKALLRRKNTQIVSSCSVSKHIQLNSVVVNWSLRQVQQNGQDIHLTKTAFNILQCLYKHKNKVVSRDLILNEVWGENVFVDNRTVDNFVSQLKKSLHLHSENTTHIKSVRGVGYCLLINEN